MAKRAQDGTRWIDGKLFTLRSVHDDKDYAQELATKIRTGDATCAHPRICGDHDHYVRVVQHNYHDMGDFNRWAVFTFPKE